MNEQMKNVLFGSIAALCICGGAYMMIYGSALGKEGDRQSQVEVVEAIATDELVGTNNGSVANNNSLESNKKTMSIFNQEGVSVEIIQEGQGEGVRVGQVADVHYTGMFLDGKVFDSSVPRGQSFPVQLGSGMVIAGWEKGLLGMKTGEKRRLTIPPELGYGTQGAGGVIPPNTTLVFDVELLAIR